MSFQSQGNQSNRITDFVPSYQVKSNYLPSRVVQVNESDKHQINRDIEEDRQRGRILNQRPADFNPSRYVSYQVQEQVNVGKPIQPEQLQQILRNKK